MSEQSIDIERVVREVLAELSGPLGAAKPRSDANAGGTGRLPSDKDGAGGVPRQTVGTRSVPGMTPSNGELAIDARLVTMDDVLGRLHAVRRITVSRKAIVTPAVQDELLRRGIDLVRADSSGNEAAAVPRLVLFCCQVDLDPQPLAAALAREGVKAEQAESNCLIAATEKLAAEMADSNTLGVLLTEHTAAGLCLANRRRGLRAVSGLDAPAVATAAAAVGANLLVLNPSAASFFQVKQIVTEFCRGGVRRCPEVFRQALS